MGLNETLHRFYRHMKRPSLQKLTWNMPQGCGRHLTRNGVATLYPIRVNAPSHRDLERLRTGPEVDGAPAGFCKDEPASLQMGYVLDRLVAGNLQAGADVAD